MRIDQRYGNMGQATLVFGVTTCLMLFGFLAFSFLHRLVLALAGITEESKVWIRSDAIFQNAIAYLPPAVGGGIVLIIAGIYIGRGSDLARYIAQITAFCGIVWIIVFAVGGLSFWEAVGFSLAPGLPEKTERMINIIGLSAIGLAGAAFPSMLLLFLRKR